MVRMRVTKRKRNNRRSHHKATISDQTLEEGTPRLRHHASRKTGIYRGKTVIQVVNKKQKDGEGEEVKTTVENVEMPGS